MIWAGSIHRKFGLYPCWMPKGPRRERAHWLTRSVWVRWRAEEVKDYHRNHKLYNLDDRLHGGMWAHWRHLWRKS